MRKPHWIMKEHLCGQIEYVCSRCGAAFDNAWEECPECGVKMKKVKYDPILVEEYEMLDILLGDDEDDW
ncbi:MAG: hypothetical protein IJG40_05120 [Oscillospiraceae bacterium]|nr:hypothetical protein [Oscillospiraceae bacterium]